MNESGCFSLLCTKNAHSIDVVSSSAITGLHSHVGDSCVDRHSLDVIDESERRQLTR